MIEPYDKAVEAALERGQDPEEYLNDIYARTERKQKGVTEPDELQALLTKIAANMGVLIIMAVLFCSPVRADEVYSYQGSLFSGSFTVANQLFSTPGYPTREAVDFTAFSFTDGALTINQSDVSAGWVTIAISADTSGQVSQWLIDISDGQDQIFTSFYGSATESTDLVLTPTGWTSIEGQMGTWTETDPPTATPEPSALWLLLLPLFGLAFARNPYGTASRQDVEVAIDALEIEDEREKEALRKFYERERKQSRHANIRLLYAIGIFLLKVVAVAGVAYLIIAGLLSL
jgi:hypothetical protein